MSRGIPLGYWKVHILHHAGEGPILGQWLLQERTAELQREVLADPSAARQPNPHEGRVATP